MSNSCNASNEKKTAVIDIKRYCVVSTLLRKSIFQKRVFAQSLRLFCERKFRSKSLEAAIISAFMTCSNIATHKEISFLSHSFLFVSMWHYSPVRMVITRRQRQRERQKSNFYASSLQVHQKKKKRQQKNKKKARQLRPRNRRKVKSRCFKFLRSYSNSLELSNVGDRF